MLKNKGWDGIEHVALPQVSAALPLSYHPGNNRNNRKNINDKDPKN